jgi:hypothetical protein
MFTMGLRQLVATHMLKLCQLKATCSQTRVLPFEPHESHVTLVEYEISRVMIITSTSPKITRLMVNQLMCLCHGASYHERVIF